MKKETKIAVGILSHHFNVKLATLIGLNEAILLNHFWYWNERNEDLENRLKDPNHPYPWTYNSGESMHRIFPYLSIREIRTAIKNLVDNGWLITGNFNKAAFDKTKWYSITEKTKVLFDSSFEVDLSVGQNDQSIVQNDQPIPNYNNYINPTKEEIKESYSSLSSTPLAQEDKDLISKFAAEDLISKYSNKSIFDNNPIFGKTEQSKKLANNDSTSFNEAHSASEKELGKIKGCKPLEYIPTDQERWAEEQEGIAREECESFLNTLLEIWNGIIQDKEDCLFQIFKLSELSRLEAEVALKGRVKLNNWLLAGKTLNTIDDFLKHQVKKSEEEWLGIL